MSNMNYGALDKNRVYFLDRFVEIKDKDCTGSK